MKAPLDTPVYLKAGESLRIADGAGFEVNAFAVISGSPSTEISRTG